MGERPRSKPEGGFAAITLVAGYVFATLVEKALYALPFFLVFFFAVRTTVIAAIICALIFGSLTETALTPSSDRRKSRKENGRA